MPSGGLELVLRFDIGALESGLHLPAAVEDESLILGGAVLLHNAGFADFEAGEFPLRDRHLFDIMLFIPLLRLPDSFQIRAKLVEILALFAGQDSRAGTKAVTPSGGARRLQRVATISLDLFDCSHFFLNKQSQIGEPRGALVFLLGTI